MSLLCFGMAAMLWDLQSGKIPNGLIMAGLICALAYQCVKYGAVGVVLFLGGSILPGLLLGILFYFRMIGAGDIKLFCMIGGYVGPEDCWECMICSVLFGGIISLIIMIRNKNLGQRLSYLGRYISDYTEYSKWKPYISYVDTDAKFCFSVPVMLSIIIYVGNHFF